MTSLVRLGVSPAASTPTGVFTQRFEALFPSAGALGCVVCFAPPQFLRLSMHECGTAVSASCRTAFPVRSFHNLPPPWVCQQRSPLHPSCPSPPLLLVWINVSSLSPWLLDFHAVRFSVSSGCFLFLNCCCPPFGCARRRSVSPYASILAAHQENLSF